MDTPFKNFRHLKTSLQWPKRNKRAELFIPNASLLPRSSRLLNTFLSPLHRICHSINQQIRKPPLPPNRIHVAGTLHPTDPHCKWSEFQKENPKSYYWWRHVKSNLQERPWQKLVLYSHVSCFIKIVLKRINLSSRKESHHNDIEITIKIM